MVIEKQQSRVKIVILRVKDKYLECDNVQLKRYVGKVLSGEIKK